MRMAQLNDDEFKNFRRISSSRNSVGRMPLQDLNVISNFDEEPTSTATTATLNRRRVSFNNKFNIKEFNAEEGTLHVLHAPEYEEPLLCVSSDSSCQMQTCSSSSSIQSEFVERSQVISSEKMEMCSNYIKENNIKKDNVTVTSINSDSQSSSKRRYSRKSIGTYSGSFMESTRISSSEINVEETMSFRAYIDVNSIDKSSNSSMDVDTTNIENVNFERMASSSMRQIDNDSNDESDMSLTRPIPEISTSLASTYGSMSGVQDDLRDMSITKVVPSLVNSNMRNTPIDMVDHLSSAGYENSSDISLTRCATSLRYQNPIDMSISRVDEQPLERSPNKVNLMKDLSSTEGNNASNVNSSREISSFQNNRSNIDMTGGIPLGVSDRSMTRGIPLGVSDRSMTRGIPFMKNNSVDENNFNVVKGTQPMEINYSSEMSITRGHLPFVNSRSDVSTRGLSVDRSMSRGSVNSENSMSFTKGPFSVENPSDMSMIIPQTSANSRSDMSISRGLSSVNSENVASVTGGHSVENISDDMKITNSIRSGSNVEACGMSITTFHCQSNDIIECEDIAPKLNNSKKKIGESLIDKYPNLVKDVDQEKSLSFSRHKNLTCDLEGKTDEGDLTVSNRTNHSFKNNTNFEEISMSKKKDLYLSKSNLNASRNASKPNTVYDDNDDTMNFSFTCQKVVHFCENRNDSLPLDLTKVTENENFDKYHELLMKENYDIRVEGMEQDLNVDNSMMSVVHDKTNNLSRKEDHSIQKSSKISPVNVTFNIDGNILNQLHQADDSDGKNKCVLGLGMSNEDNNANECVNIDSSMAENTEKSKVISQSDCADLMDIPFVRPKDSSFYGEKINPLINKTSSKVTNEIERDEEVIKCANKDSISYVERCEYDKNLQVCQNNSVSQEKDKMENIPDIIVEMYSDSCGEKSTSTGCTVKVRNDCNIEDVQIDKLNNDDALIHCKSNECDKVQDDLNKTDHDIFSKEKSLIRSDVSSAKERGCLDFITQNEKREGTFHRGNEMSHVANICSGNEIDLHFEKSNESVGLEKNVLKGCDDDMAVSSMAEFSKNLLIEKPVEHCFMETDIPAETEEAASHQESESEQSFNDLCRSLDKQQRVFERCSSKTNQSDQNAESNDTEQSNQSEVCLSERAIRTLDLTNISIRKKSFRKSFNARNACRDDSEEFSDITSNISMTNIVQNDDKDYHESGCEKTGAPSCRDDNIEELQEINLDGQSNSSHKKVPGVGKRKSADSFVMESSDDDLESPLKIPRHEDEMIIEENCVKNSSKNTKEIPLVDDNCVIVHGSHDLLNFSSLESGNMMSKNTEVTEMDTDSLCVGITYPKQPEPISYPGKFRFPFKSFEFRSHDCCCFKYVADNKFSWLFFDGVLNFSVESCSEDFTIVKNVQMNLNEPVEKDKRYLLFFARNVMNKFDDELKKFKNTNDVSPLLNNIIHYVEQNDVLFNNLSKHFILYPLRIIDNDRLLYEVVSSKHLWFEVTMSDKIVFERISDTELSIQNIIGSVSLPDIQHILRMCSHPLENQLIKFISLLEDFKNK